MERFNVADVKSSRLLHTGLLYTGLLYTVGQWLIVYTEYHSQHLVPQPGIPVFITIDSVKRMIIKSYLIFVRRPQISLLNTEGNFHGRLN